MPPDQGLGARIVTKKDFGTGYSSCLPDFPIRQIKNQTQSFSRKSGPGSGFLDLTVLSTRPGLPRIRS
jgi:hypothetical protein